jgi:hypothetical protein
MLSNLEIMYNVHRGRPGLLAVNAMPSLEGLLYVESDSNEWDIVAVAIIGPLFGILLNGYGRLGIIQICN